MHCVRPPRMGNRLDPRHRSLLQGSGGTRAARRLIVGAVLGVFFLLLAWTASSVVRGSPSQEPEAAAPVAEAREAGTSPASWSSEGATKKSNAWDGGQSTEGTSPLQVGAALIGVLALVVAAAFLLRRVLERARLAPARTRQLQLMDALPIGPKRFVYLVRYGTRTLVIGAGSEQVSLLAEYEDEEGRAAPATTTPRAMPAPGEPSVAAIAASKEEPAAPRPQPIATVSARAVEAYRDAARPVQPTDAIGGDDLFAPDGAASVPDDAAPAPVRPSPARSAATRTGLRRPATIPSTEDELPAGAHRVPPQFRHLLRRALQEEAR